MARMGLCLILTVVWMAGSRPSTAIGTESTHSRPWWEAKEYAQIRAAAASRRASGDFESLEAIYRRALDLASEQANVAAQIVYGIDLGNARLARFHYTEALKAYAEARKLAFESQDWLRAGLVCFNLSTLYEQVWDLPSALRAAQEGQAVLARIPPPYYRAQLLLQLARLYFEQHDGRSVAMFAQGIEAARDQGDLALEAQGRNLLGAALIDNGDFRGAEAQLVEGFRLRMLHDRRHLETSYEKLGRLRLAQAQAEESGTLRESLLREAAFFTKKALGALGRAPADRSIYTRHHQLGQILEAQRHTDEALHEYQLAVQTATVWRSAIPPASSSMVGADTELQRRVFSTFIETAARQAQEGSRDWAAASFLATEANRAASLRETLAVSPSWREKVPRAYWESLHHLRSETERLLRINQNSSALADRLKLGLTEMEAAAGVRDPAKNSESFGPGSSLKEFQTGLRSSELFLSVHLGDTESLLWAVTKNSFRQLRLTSEKKIGRQAVWFRDAIRTGSADAVEHGRRLYGLLFGQLMPEESGKPNWLLSIEGSLSEVPFAALVIGERGGKTKYLMERNAVQIVPGAFLLRAASDKTNGGLDKTNGGFIGVGDPVYNSADPRWGTAWSRPTLARSLGLISPTAGAEMQLNRLPESGAEVEACRRSWEGPSIVLRGSAARRDKFLRSLESSPSVIHLATHVLMPRANRDQAFVAFGAGPGAQPELLAASDVARLRVPGSLVVMTGCATAEGEITDGAGVLGLTRAWQSAGSTAVIGTGWPVPDQSGHLMPAFYRQWKHSSTAEALRQSQLAMLRSGGWEAEPRYWASYQINGGGR